MFLNILKILASFCVGGWCGMAVAICLSKSKKDIVRRACVVAALAGIVLIAFVFSSIAVLIAELIGCVASIVITPLAIAASNRDKVGEPYVE